MHAPCRGGLVLICLFFVFVLLLLLLLRLLLLPTSQFFIRYIANLETALKHFAAPLRKLVEAPNNPLPGSGGTSSFHQEDYILTFANLEDIVVRC